MAANLDFPASASASLIQGYCDDFVQLAATLAQTLEQVSMRNLPLGDNRQRLGRVERGMKMLAEAIGSLLEETADQSHARLATSPAEAGLDVLSGGEFKPRTAKVAGERKIQSGKSAAGKIPAGRQPTPDGRQQLNPTTGGRAVKPAGTVVFQGSTESMPVRSVLQFLSRMRKTGTLLLSLESERMSIDMIDGSVSGTTSDRPPEVERVGDLLVEKGFIAPEELVPFRSAPPGSVPIGAELVKAGKITEGQLLEALELQVRRRVDRAVRAMQASYAFHEGPRRRGDGRIRIRPFELLGRQ